MELDKPDDVEIDRRSDPRISVSVRVTMNSDSNFYVGLVDNISEGGLFVATHDLLPIGSTLQLKFRLAEDDDPIRARAKVQWHRTVSAPDDGVTPGFGVSFVEIDESDRERLEEFVEEREPMFHPG